MALASAQLSSAVADSSDLIAAAQRSLSKWGATFVPNRNRLGLETAEKLIFVQQNDPAASDERETDVLIVQGML